MDNANSLTGSGPIAHSEEMMWVIEGRRVVGVLGRALVVTSLVSGIAAGAQSTMKSGAEAPDAPLVAPVQRPGPALRSALATLERGDSVAAERQLLGIVERHPVIANDAAFLLAELQMESGRYQEVVDSAPRWQSAPSRLRTRFLRLLGEALAGLGEEKRARAVWDSAARATGDSGERAALRIAIAESHDRSGDPAAAVDPYLQVWTRDPASESAPLALEGLDRLERELGHALRDGNDYRRRGDSLYRKRHNERALAAYEHALGLELPEGERLKVREGRARTLFRLRRYTEAANAYADLPGDPDRRIQLGRALARAGKISEGVTELEGLGAESAGEVSARALLLAGLLREGEGDFEPARQHFLSVTERAPSSGTARAARWRLGWGAYREGRLEEAADYFEVLASEEADPVAALRPRYWRSRALERLGQAAESAARYAEIAREFPLSYYGWRAAQRSHGVGAARPVEVIAEGSMRIGPADTALPRVLLEAGLLERAREELEALAGRARGLGDRVSLAQLYADAGDFHAPQRLMVDAYAVQLARGPSPAQLDLWWHAWPAPFDRELQEAAQNGATAPADLVYAVMREESGYRPEVLSVSGARGLLQLMPATAEKLAVSVQLQPFTADDLFLPALNIRLGSRYLSDLLARFDGRASAVIGSYNAGPHVVARWLQQDAAEDDAWVEEIPYNQTRGYVKRVLRSLYVYQVLY